MYFAGLRVQGKLIRKTLKTDVISVAKLRLSDLEKAERQTAETLGKLGRGKVKFVEALDILKERITGDVNLKPRCKDYYSERLNALTRSWPSLAGMDIRDITKTDCQKRAGEFGPKASAGAYNNTLKVLRDALDIGVELGPDTTTRPRLLTASRPSPKRLNSQHKGNLIAGWSKWIVWGDRGQSVLLPIHPDLLARLEKLDSVDRAAAFLCPRPRSIRAEVERTV